jgi:hypothetical protein
LGGKNEKGSETVRFERTVLSDNDLWKDANSQFFLRQGWDLKKLVRLSESDTAYGQSSDNQAPIDARFPSGLARIRSAWEEDERARRQPNRLVAALPRSALDPNLESQTAAVDVVPQLGKLTVPNNDAALSNLLDRLRWEGVRYITIRASDADDRIFLAKHVRRSVPGAILVLTSNSLLYAHGAIGDQLQGTLVVNSFPLTLEDEHWKDIFPGPQTSRYRRQFSSSFQEGTYLAARRLLMGEAEHEDPTQVGWIAAVGGGKLWPISLLGPTSQVKKALSELGFAKQYQRNDLGLLGIMIGLFLLAYSLNVLRRPPSGKGSAWPNEPAFRYMVWLGSALLALMSAMVLIVATLPFWNLAYGADEKRGLAEAFHQALGEHLIVSSFYLAGLALAFVLTLFQLSNVVRSQGEEEQTKRATLLAKLLALIAGLLMLAGLNSVLHRYWMVGGPELFDLRGRYFSSGLSPLPPWLLLGLAIFLWLLLELHRGRRLALQAIDWPVSPERKEPPLEGSQEIARSLDQMLKSTLPSIPFLPASVGEPKAKPAFVAPKSRFWLGLSIAVLPLLLRLIARIQPICERRPSGFVFLGLLTLCVVIGASSFRQFLVSWLTLERLLRRLALSRLQKAFENLKGEIPWSPMRSFGWRLPNFDMVSIAVRKLEEGWGFGGLVRKEVRDSISEQLRGVFLAETNRNLLAENEARTTLNRLLRDVSFSLPEGLHRKAEEFLAIRIATFIRPVFLHMRYCLAEALVTFVLALFAVNSYAFQPKWFALFGLWAAILSGIVLTFWAFAQMDRHPTLSAIGGTDAGKLTLDHHFFWNVFNWGVVPLIAAVAVYFPPVGRVVSGLLSPILGLGGN